MAEIGGTLLPLPLQFIIAHNRNLVLTNFFIGGVSNGAKRHKPEPAPVGYPPHPYPPPQYGYPPPPYGWPVCTKKSQE